MLTGSEELEIVSGRQRWLTSWHTPVSAPEGKNHGSAGICVGPKQDLVLVSQDGVIWDFPAGRPEGAESREETLRREMLEEACAVVLEARLLGFCRSRCIEGQESGLVLVRSIWRASVELLDWNPQFEIAHLRLVPIADVGPLLPAEFLPVWLRAFEEAGFSPDAG